MKIHNTKHNKAKFKSLIVYILLAVLYSCEPIIEYIEIEKEVIVTEYLTEIVTQEVEIEVVRDVEVILTEYVNVIEYVEREVIIEKYIEVDKIIEVITEVEVERIIETEKIVEVEVEVIEYIDVPVEVVRTEYVDRVETVTEYIDRVETVIQYVEVESDPIVQIVEKDVIIDNIINTETIVYLTKEIYVMAEPEIIIEPIKEYDNYISMENKVVGVTEEGFEEIPLISGLFKIDGVIYFSVYNGENELLCSQESGVVTIIEPADFPEVPESTHFEFESGDYKIQNSVYGDEDISKVYNGSPNVAYYMIDGACLRGSDLIYSTPIDTGSRLKGVYLWTVNGNPLRVMEDGRIW